MSVWGVEVETKPSCVVPTSDCRAVQGWAFVPQHLHKGESYIDVCVSPGRTCVPLLLEQLSRGAQGYHLWHGSPNCRSLEDGLVLSKALQAFLVPARSPLNVHHWCALERVWDGSKRIRSVVLVCLSNAETPLFLVLCNGLQESDLGISPREKGHGDGSWLLLLMMLQRGGDTGSLTMLSAEACQLLKSASSWPRGLFSIHNGIQKKSMQLDTAVLNHMALYMYNQGYKVPFSLFRGVNWCTESNRITCLF